MDPKAGLDAVKKRKIFCPFFGSAVLQSSPLCHVTTNPKQLFLSDVIKWLSVSTFHVNRTTRQLEGNIWKYAGERSIANI
jgi:hypothetical protein